jgi:hypothetical protein
MRRPFRLTTIKPRCQGWRSCRVWGSGGPSGGWCSAAMRVAHQCFGCVTTRDAMKVTTIGTTPERWGRIDGRSLLRCRRLGRAFCHRLAGLDHRLRFARATSGQRSRSDILSSDGLHQTGKTAFPVRGMLFCYQVRGQGSCQFMSSIRASPKSSVSSRRAWRPNGFPIILLR